MWSSQILTVGTRPIGGCDGEFSDSHCRYSAYRWILTVGTRL